MTRTSFFGWYPLWEQNPTYICLHLVDLDLQGADLEVAKRLRDQLKNFQSISQLVFYSDETKKDAK
jgi:hypothetical protein